MGTVREVSVMSRYIDAEKVLMFISRLTGAIPLFLIREVEDNGIDIVRCKECKWAEPNREDDYDCRCHIPIFRVSADDFCSMGERREP